jgi:hypothetical protein
MPLWTALTRGLDAARQEARETGQAMPWETRDEIAWISWEDLETAMAAALNSVVEEVEERRRLVDVAQGAYEELIAQGAGTARPLKAGRLGIRQCVRPGCGKQFAPIRDTHIYCSSSCRARACKDRQAVAAGVPAAQVAVV